MCYLSIPHNGHLQWQWQWVLVSLGLTHNLHRWKIQSLEAVDKWPCGDCFTYYSAMLCDDVLIENNKYDYITKQNNRAMKIVNFTPCANDWNRAFFPPVHEHQVQGYTAPWYDMCSEFNDNNCSYQACKHCQMCLKCGHPHPAILCSGSFNQAQGIMCPAWGQQRSYPKCQPGHRQ